LTRKNPDHKRLPRVFIDADVLVAGSASAEGASHLLLQLGELGLLDVVASAQVREEAERALSRKLPSALPAFQMLADAAVRWLPNPPAETLSEHVDRADAKDLAILVAAIRAGADVLLTFNTRHYRQASSPPRIEPPGTFLQRLRTRLQDLAEPQADTEEER
jgi:predicted nucleic acid-binding protein